MFEILKLLAIEALSHLQFKPVRRQIKRQVASICAEIFIGFYEVRELRNIFGNLHIDTAIFNYRTGAKFLFNRSSKVRYIRLLATRLEQYN